MSRLTGLFLGAGASFEAGMPLVWDLTAEIKKWLTQKKLSWFNEQWRAQGGGYPDSVIDDLAMTLSREDLHYEGVLGYLETQYRRQHSLQQEYHGLYSWLVQMVYFTLYLRHINNVPYISRQLRSYVGIQTLSQDNSPLWIFSLNHDLIVEAIAAHLSIPVSSGFGPEIVTLPRRDANGKKQGELRGEVLSKQTLDSGGMNFLRIGQTGINLLKVHGALDVFTFRDGEDLLRLLPDELSPAGVIAMLKAANEELLYAAPGHPAGKVWTTNEIAYADEEGEMQFLRRSLLAGAFKFDKRGSQVLPLRLLEHFRSNLNFVSTLICMGYGFGDIHINTILKEWLEFHADRRLEIVNPNAGGVPPFLLHVSPQVTVTKATATMRLAAAT